MSQGGTCNAYVCVSGGGSGQFLYLLNLFLVYNLPGLFDREVGAIVALLNPFMTEAVTI